MSDQKPSEDQEDEGSDCGGCCSGCQGSCSGQSIDVESLGEEAVEVAEMFKEVDAHLVNALMVRKRILEKIESRSNESAEMKEKMDKVLQAQHPVLLQFVLGQ